MQCEKETNQNEAVYEINLDYLMSLNGHGDVFDIWWDRRDADLRYVLIARQYDKYITLAHFYRPVVWWTNSWTFAVYAHYDSGRFFNPHPNLFVNKNVSLNNKNKVCKLSLLTYFSAKVIKI